MGRGFRPLTSLEKILESGVVAPTFNRWGKRQAVYKVSSKTTKVTLKKKKKTTEHNKIKGKRKKILKQCAVLLKAGMLVVRVVNEITIF